VFVNYVDYTLVRLADESARAVLFDQVALEQLVLAGYDADALLLSPPYSAVFDEFSVGLALPHRSTIEVIWTTHTGERRDARLSGYGLSSEREVRVDALWRGAVIARSRSAVSHIESVLASWPNATGVDDEIIAAAGQLPSDPDVLERERRTRMLARLRAGLRQPDALSDAVFEQWLRNSGARSVSELMIKLGNQTALGTLQLRFTPATSESDTPRRLPVSVAILVRDAPLAVAELLSESKLVRDRLRELGIERAADPSVSARQPVLVAWVIPETVFDDAGWPGAEDAGAVTPEAKNALRRKAAGRWLAREGIGLVATKVQAL
jgi:hypothetical protein